MKLRRSVNLTILMSLVPFLVPAQLCKPDFVLAILGQWCQEA